MSNISLNEYTNIYRNILGGKTLSNDVAINNLLVHRDFTADTVIDTSSKDRDYVLIGSSSLIVKTINSLPHNSAPVTKISNLNVKSRVVKTYPNTSQFNFSDYSTLSNIASLSVSSSYATTQLISEQMIVLPRISNDGVSEIHLTIVSGKYCEIKLSAADGTGIETIDNLPGSLIFDSAINTIKGIPFVVGQQLSSITLNNDVKVTLLFNIIPLSLANGI